MIIVFVLEIISDFLHPKRFISNWDLPGWPHIFWSICYKCLFDIRTSEKHSYFSSDLGRNNWGGSVQWKLFYFYFICWKLYIIFRCM